MYEGKCPTCDADVGFIRMITGKPVMVERTVLVGASSPAGVLCATESGASARIVAGEGTLRGHPLHRCGGGS